MYLNCSHEDTRPAVGDVGNDTSLLSALCLTERVGLVENGKKTGFGGAYQGDKFHQ